MRIKNVSGEDRSVPWLGGRLVVDEQEVTVPKGTVFAYTQQEKTWAPADDEAQAEHDEGLAACAVALVEQGRVGELLVKTQSARELAATVRDPQTPAVVVRQIVDAELVEEEPRSTVVKAAAKRLNTAEAQEVLDRAQAREDAAAAELADRLAEARALLAAHDTDPEPDPVPETSTNDAGEAGNGDDAR